MDYLQIANSPLMWAACICPVILVFVQAIIMTRKTLNIGKKIGVTDSQIKDAVVSSAISSLGPSVVNVVGMVALLIAMGAPVAWDRLSYIGNVGFEVGAASFGTEAMGISLGSEDMTAQAFANALWVMSAIGCGWILITALFTPKLGQFNRFLAGGRKETLPLISAAAMSGAFAYLTMNNVKNFNHTSVSALGGFIVMGVFMLYNKKANKKWIREWAMTISMFAGMIVSAFFM